MKEKKNNPKLAVNIMQEIEKKIKHQECLIPTLSLCFDQLANSVIFEAEFCVFVSLSCKRDSLTNRPLHGFSRHLGCGAVAAKITANVWDIVQLSTPITPELYIGF